jgi:hypothetical protein
MWMLPVFSLQDKWSSTVYTNEAHSKNVWHFPHRYFHQTLLQSLHRNVSIGENIPGQAFSTTQAELHGEVWFYFVSLA